MDNTVQKLVVIRQEAHGLLHKYGLLEKGWKFEFSSTQQIIGDCDHRTKTIRFSTHYMQSDRKQITDTLLHEIAHALVPSKHGHDATWKAMAMRVGADPFSYPDEVTAKTQLKSTAKPNYRIKCKNPDCGWTTTRFRLKRSLLAGARCPRCHGMLEFFKIVRS